MLWGEEVLNPLYTYEAYKFIISEAWSLSRACQGTFGSIRDETKKLLTRLEFALLYGEVKCKRIYDENY